MKNEKKLNIAIIGLGFGAEFIPIYQKHPNTNLKVICDSNKENLDEVGNLFKVDNRTDSYDEVLKDPDIDVIHLVTPIGEHAPMTIQALKAGKHVGSTVPMATTLDECRQIVELVKETGLKYMMMETAVYTREFLYMKELYDKGELGDIQYIMASHPQDMDGWPDYWPGLPPMWYATHCMAPALGIMRSKAESVSCIGSGKIRDDLIAIHNSPFAIESAHVKFLNSNVYAHVHRNLFDTARQYKESLDVYGSKKSVEWPLIEGKPLVVHTAKMPEPEIPQETVCPDYAKLLPDEIAQYTTQSVYEGEQGHLSFTQGAGHGGSHPHLVHELVTALLENRDPYPNAVESANITCVGILAHDSAMKGGETIQLPEWSLK
jgi:predicted dehydrogenase